MFTPSRLPMSVPISFVNLITLKYNYAFTFIFPLFHSDDVDNRVCLTYTFRMMAGEGNVFILKPEFQGYVLLSEYCSSMTPKGRGPIPPAFRSLSLS